VIWWVRSIPRTKGAVQVDIRRLSNTDLVSVGPQVVTSTGSNAEPAEESDASRVVVHITGLARAEAAIYKRAASETAVGSKAINNVENLLIPSGANIYICPFSKQTKDICDHWPVPCLPRPDSPRSSAAT
jgi:hypothetical protein